MNLFQTGLFNLHSGEASDFKIDCDALSDEDIATIASQLVRRLPEFTVVEGVPQGGLRLAAALIKYSTSSRGLLIVDDVFTSGESMAGHRNGRECLGAVIFARNPTPSWITSLFQLSP